MATGAVVGVGLLLRQTSPPPPACLVGTGSDRLVLAIEQAENATTIAAAARRLALPTGAVTVAIATALQESKLHNYPFGDRDSLGLFQQRPSQGWGRPDQLLTPSYAATAFLRRLATVPHWRRLDVAIAAQEVQHSADGTAYAQWEEQARAIARVITGRVPAGMTCRFTEPGRPQPGRLRKLAERELGAAFRPDGAAPAATDWTVAAWLVAHARSYGLAVVTARGQRWTPEPGEWVAADSAASEPHYEFVQR